MAFRGNITPTEVVRALEKVLPNGWHVSTGRGTPRARESGLVITFTAPGGARATLPLDLRGDLTPAQAAEVARSNREAVLVSRFLSPRTRERLKAAGISHADLTGNVWVSLERPAVFIDVRGAERDVRPRASVERSLKGAAAARVVRALCEFRPPQGVRELATRAGTTPGYVSKLVRFLEAEDLIKRRPRGAITEVAWPELTRRWAQDYDVLKTNHTTRYLAPRGLPAIESALAASGLTYALTASSAARRIAPVAVSPLMICYVEDPVLAAERLGLHQAEAGVNVILAVPFDPVIFERTWERNGLRFVSLPQATVDLLTSPGRGPAEGEALLKWMAEHENDWRR